MASARGATNAAALITEYCKRSRRAESLNSLGGNFNFVDGNAFDLCSNMTVNGLRNDGNTPAGHPARLVQEMLKNCIDDIKNDVRCAEHTV